MTTIHLGNAIYLRPGHLILVAAAAPVIVLAVSVAWTIVPIVVQEVLQHVVTAVVRTFAGG
jgi:hypothetical protein